MLTELLSRKSFPNKRSCSSSFGRKMRQFCLVNCSSPSIFLITSSSTIWPITASLLHCDALFILKRTEVFNLFGLIFNFFYNWNGTRVNVQPVSKVQVVGWLFTKMDSNGPESAKLTEISTAGFLVQVFFN